MGECLETRRETRCHRGRRPNGRRRCADRGQRVFAPPTRRDRLWRGGRSSGSARRRHRGRVRPVPAASRAIALARPCARRRAAVTRRRIPDAYADHCASRRAPGHRQMACARCAHSLWTSWARRRALRCGTRCGCGLRRELLQQSHRGGVLPARSLTGRCVDRADGGRAGNARRPVARGRIRCDGVWQAGGDDDRALCLVCRLRARCDHVPRPLRPEARRRADHRPGRLHLRRCDGHGMPQPAAAFTSARGKRVSVEIVERWDSRVPRGVQRPQRAGRSGHRGLPSRCSTISSRLASRGSSPSDPSLAMHSREAISPAPSRPSARYRDATALAPSYNVARCLSPRAPRAR